MQQNSDLYRSDCAFSNIVRKLVYLVFKKIFASLVSFKIYLFNGMDGIPLLWNLQSRAIVHFSVLNLRYFRQCVLKSHHINNKTHFVVQGNDLTVHFSVTLLNKKIISEYYCKKCVSCDIFIHIYSVLWLYSPPLSSLIPSPISGLLFLNKLSKIKSYLTKGGSCLNKMTQPHERDLSRKSKSKIYIEMTSI
jgi:hypothetical protein